MALSSGIALDILETILLIKRFDSQKPPRAQHSGRFSRLRLCALCALLFIACKPEPEPPHVDGMQPAPLPEPMGPKVVFLGDSISAGIHLAESEAFPAVLQRKLTERGKPFHLVNAGVSGDTTAGGVSRLDWLLQQKPAIVVVELGANDAMRGIAPAEVEKNLRAIVKGILAAGAKPLLLGMRIPPSYGQEHAEAFAKVYERVAEDFDVAFVPFFMKDVAGVPALNLEDGIHPTAKGHEKLAESVEDALYELVK